MESILQLKQLTKRVKNRNLVENLSFDVKKGEVFGFLGPNGAGKTTTIRMIVGLSKITSGQVLIHGHDVTTDFTSAMKHIGAIVENPEMYKYLTGYENLAHFARLSNGVSKERMQEVIQLVGLEGRIHEKVKTYSLGMRQRLGMAQALLHKPSLLILDEPTNGLDPAGIHELRRHLRQLADVEGIAVLVSSHLLSEIELMCDRVAIIDHGKLISVRDLHQAEQDDAMTVLFEVDAPTRAAEVLQGLSLQEIETPDNQTVSARLKRSQIPEVTRQLVSAGLDLYAIKPMTNNLENQFLELTGGRQGV